MLIDDPSCEEQGPAYCDHALQAHRHTCGQGTATALCLGWELALHVSVDIHVAGGPLPVANSQLLAHLGLSQVLIQQRKIVAELPNALHSNLVSAISSNRGHR